MLTLNTTLAAVQQALDYFARRSPVPSAWRTAEWEQAPAEIANRSLFSAGVESARFLTTAQSNLTSALQMATDQFGRLPSREKFISDLRGVALSLGLGTPDQPANLKNLAGATRLGLIYDMNVTAAQGRARRSAGLSEGALFAAPAQELVRGRTARIPRDWRARWAEAGDKVSWEGALPADNARFIALKTSPIWTALSRFGVPWPPFDFGSGMVLRNISRADAIALRLIEEDEILAADPDPDFNTGLAATMQGISPRVAEGLANLFGDRLIIQGTTARWAT